MPTYSDEEKLFRAEETLAKIEITLGKLYEKRESSTSFGDQSQTLASIGELEKSRDRYRNEIEVLKRAVNQSRKTLKIHFR